MKRKDVWPWAVYLAPHGNDLGGWKRRLWSRGPVPLSANGASVALSGTIGESSWGWDLQVMSDTKRKGTRFVLMGSGQSRGLSNVHPGGPCSRDSHVHPTDAWVAVVLVEIKIEKRNQRRRG